MLVPDLVIGPVGESKPSELPSAFPFGSVIEASEKLIRENVKLDASGEVAWYATIQAIHAAEMPPVLKDFEAKQLAETKRRADAAGTTAGLKRAQEDFNRAGSAQVTLVVQSRSVAQELFPGYAVTNFLEPGFNVTTTDGRLGIAVLILNEIDYANEFASHETSLNRAFVHERFGHPLAKIRAMDTEEAAIAVEVEVLGPRVRR
jgi:hypothetical protein